MPEASHCAECGVRLPSGWSEPLCSTCALKGVVAPSRETVSLSLALASADAKEGDWIGRYKLLQKIGEGGCGTVYMAEQKEPVRRRVALKVIKLGMDTKAVIARFEAERQADRKSTRLNSSPVSDSRMPSSA